MVLTKYKKYKKMQAVFRTFTPVQGRAKRVETIGSDDVLGFMMQNKPFAYKLDEPLMPLCEQDFDSFVLSALRHLTVDELDVALSLTADFSSKHYITKRMKVADFINYDGSLRLYTAQNKIYDGSSEDERKVGSPLIVDKLILPEFVQRLGDSISVVNFWLNKQPVVSAWHCDLYDNFLIVLKGTKHVKLYMPAKDTGWKLNLSDSFHLLAKDDGCLDAGGAFHAEVTLHENELLRIPEYCYHRVESEPDTFAVNVWLRNHTEFFVDNRSLCTSFFFRHTLEEFMERQWDKNREPLSSIVDGLVGSLSKPQKHTSLRSLRQRMLLEYAQVKGLEEEIVEGFFARIDHMDLGRCFAKFEKAYREWKRRILKRIVNLRLDRSRF